MFTLLEITIGKLLTLNFLIETSVPELDQIHMTIHYAFRHKYDGRKFWLVVALLKATYQP